MSRSLGVPATQHAFEDVALQFQAMKMKHNPEVIKRATNKVAKLFSKFPCVRSATQPLAICVSTRGAYPLLPLAVYVRTRAHALCYPLLYMLVHGAHMLSAASHQFSPVYQTSLAEKPTQPVEFLVEEATREPNPGSKMEEDTFSPRLYFSRKFVPWCGV